MLKRDFLVWLLSLFQGTPGTDYSPGEKTKQEEE